MNYWTLRSGGLLMGSFERSLLRIYAYGGKYFLVDFRNTEAKTITNLNYQEVEEILDFYKGANP